jgi:hypothetical protein
VRPSSYRFRGQRLEGEAFVGSAELTHNLLDGPELVAPIDGGGLQDPDHAVVEWKPEKVSSSSVTTTDR